MFSCAKSQKMDIPWVFSQRSLEDVLHQNKGISQEKGRQGSRKLKTPHSREPAGSSWPTVKKSRTTPGHQVQKPTSPIGSRSGGSGTLLQEDEIDRKLINLNVLTAELHYWPRAWSLLSCEYKQTKVHIF